MSLESVGLSVDSLNVTVKKLKIAEHVDYSFPSPYALATATEEDLLACGTGYRASYLQDAAQAVMSGELALTSLKQLPYLEAKEELTHRKGIGEKVADCICPIFPWTS